MAYYEKNLSILAFFNFVVGVARILTLITGGSEMTAGEIVLAMFRVAALFVMYVSHPLLFPILEKIPSNILNIIAIILFIIFTTDIIISFKVISNFKNVAKSIKKDSTEEITKKVKENLISRGGLYKRLVSSFDFEASDNLLSNLKARVKNEKVKAKKKIADEKKKIKLQDKKQRLKKELKNVKNEINHK